MKRKIKVTNEVEVDFEFPHYIKTSYLYIAYMDENTTVYISTGVLQSISISEFKHTETFLSWEHEVIDATEFEEAKKDFFDSINNALCNGI